MRVLILGGTGVISTGIVHGLVAGGQDVTVLNRRGSAGSSPAGSSVAALAGERSDRGSLVAARDHGPYDAVIDMVCFDADQAMLAVDVFGGTVAQWIHCSTVDVYQKDSGRYPLGEDAPRGARPSFPYAIGKVAAEKALEEAAERGAFSVTLIRPAATYVNAAVAPFGTFRLMVERMRQGLEVILPGDGSSIWTAAHRDDVAAAFVGAVGNSRAFDNAYHVAGEELLTWREYWRTIARAIGVDARFAYIPTDVLQSIAGEDAAWCVENFQYNNIFDCTAARRDLGYRYRTTWAEGVASFDLAPSDIDREVADRYDSVLAEWRARGERTQE
jgi:nucleoside-diphosphate-sugar epimerase